MGVTLSDNISCTLFCFDDHIRVKGTFSLAAQVAGKMLHCAMLKNFFVIVAESRTQFYFPQRFLQLVLQRFWPLQGILLHWAIIRATCLAMALQDKLNEKMKKLHSVTAPLMS